jgi:hypothetical protein
VVELIILKAMRSKTKRTMNLEVMLSVLCAAALSTSGFAADSAGDPGRSAGGKNPLNNLYFGEQRRHKAASPAAFAFGTRNTAADACCLAIGLSVRKTGST